MEMSKIVNLDEAELALQERQASEQVFRLRFQMRMGQNEGLKKLRELKKDIARIKTAQQQRVLGIAAPAHEAVPAPKRKKAKKKKTGKSRSTKAKFSKTKTARSKKTSKDAVKAKKTAGKTKVKSAKRGKASAKRGS